MYQLNKYSGCVKVYKNRFGHFLFPFTITNTTLLPLTALSINKTSGQMFSTDGSVSNDIESEQIPIPS